MKQTAEKVYQAGGGWVKQLADGSIIGPFASSDEAVNATKGKKADMSSDSTKAESKGKKSN